MANILIGDNTVNIDLDLGTTLVTVQQTNHRLDSLWQAEYAKYHRPWVCVSGGADSQLTANLAHRYSTGPEAVTFAFVWDHTVINAPDVVQAQRFCQSLGLPHQVIDVDLKDFLNNHLIHIAKKYECITPQLASHLWAMQLHLVPTGRPVLYGGEIPFVTVNSDENLPVMMYDSKQGSRNYGRFFKHMLLPFYLFGKINDIVVNRDPFTLTPEIHYQSIMQNTQVWQAHKLMAPETVGMVVNHLDFKYAYYLTTGYHYEFPLCKRTGFELLKQYLASQTGNYDEFDRLYRQPLHNILSQGNVHGSGIMHGQVQYTGDITDLKQQLQTSLTHCENLKTTTKYNFDW